jgi:hypothetical protein
MPASLRSGTPGSRGHPPDPLLGLHYTRIQAVRAQPLTPASADQVPQRTLLVVLKSIRASSNSRAEDSNVAKEDNPSAHSNTKSRTQAVEF